MATIQIYQYATTTIDGRTIELGSLSEARSITISDDEQTTQTFKVAPETAVKVWDKTTNSAMGNFDFIWMETDFTVSVQFTTDAGTSDAYDVKTLLGTGTANQMGPALILGSDDTKLLDGTIDTFDGTADTIDEIWVYNADDTETARVFVMVAT